jgi:release factor glutamine methyltransferase
MTRDVSAIILTRKKKLLLQKRSPYAERSPGRWGFFGGGIEREETPLQAVIRECKEELQYHLENPKLVLQRILDNKDMMYVFTEQYDGKQRLLIEDHEEMGWFSVNEAQLLDMPQSHKDTLKRISYTLFDVTDKIHPPYYEPREDSFLLQKYVSKLAKGSVLDMGTGSGILAVTAAEREEVSEILAVDIQDEVILHAKKEINNSKITVMQSNLFAKVKGKFDTIIFNAPYLPTDEEYPDPALDGGKVGYEVTLAFLEGAKSHLAKEGIILLLFSSLTNKEKVDQAIELLGFKKELLGEQHVFFEELYVYKIYLC